MDLVWTRTSRDDESSVATTLSTVTRPGADVDPRSEEMAISAGNPDGDVRAWRTGSFGYSVGEAGTTDVRIGDR